MHIQRKLEATILRYLEKPEILAIVGPRQAGKTTLLKKIQTSLKNSIFISFEDREELEFFEQDLKGFAKKYFHNRYVFIDEFQYSKNGGKSLKYLFDTYPNVKLIISGSSAIDLTIHAIKYLVGRVFVFNLYQLDFEEFLRFKDENLARLYAEYKKSFDLSKNIIALPKISASANEQMTRLFKEFVLWGGYPRVIISQSDEEKTVVLKNIYNTYFLREIKEVMGLADDFRLSKLIKALATQIGQLISYSELGIIADYDYLTLKKYLNILEKTFICSPLKPYFANKRKEITKNPKMYFFDTGLRNYVLGDFAELENRTDKGFLYENFLFNQLAKQEVPANFWRTKAGAEVDFVVEVKKEKIPIESKSQFSAGKFSRSLHSFVDEYKPSVAVVLNEKAIEKSEKNGAKVFALPHWIV